MTRLRARFGRLAPRTLAGRLALGGMAWICAWALALLLAFDLLLSQVLGGQVDVTLRARAEAVAATVRLDGGRLLVAGGDDAALDAGTSIYLGNDLVEGGALPAGLSSRLVQRGRVTADRELLGPVRYLAEPIDRGGRQVGTIVVSSDVGDESRTERVVVLAALVLVALLLLFSFFALRATVGRALRPVRAMSDQASTWSAEDLDRRFEPDAGPLELRRLAITLNELLERIAAALRHERDFTAGLSHELRTPLAHLHAEVDLLAQDRRAGTAGDDAGAAAALLTSIRRLEDLVESALSPARAGGPTAAGLGPVDDVLAGLPSPPGATARLTVTTPGPVTLAVQTDIARRALLPALENAWRYAVSEVRIDVTAAGGVARVAITDDGGQLAPADLERIFTPGFRADPHDGHPGAGLGLALTRRIARSAGGDATAGISGGHTTIVVTFPCLPAAYEGS